MFENSDLIVCLPGGIGTISELLSFIEEKRSNDKDVPILIYDENNYYKELFDMINKSISNRFTDNSIYNMVSVAHSYREFEDIFIEKRGKIK